MPEVTITVGGREFQVACQEGEEPFLQTAAEMLDAEAQTLIDQIGRMPEARMLLMAGLLLADKAAGANDRAAEMTAAVGTLTARLEAAEDAAQEALRNPVTVEVARIPDEVTDTLAELAARAEALADTVDEAVAATG